ncbi:hypothetical protein PQX77_011649 [Marasmius sp. AFHP31]|nr:hypothetical protein PQX77_011649 [Marasmius sp. AFHP31]
MEHDYGASAQITFENVNKAAAVKEAHDGRMCMRYSFPLLGKEATSKLLLLGLTPDSGTRNITSIFGPHSAHICRINDWFRNNGGPVPIQFKTKAQAMKAFIYASALHRKLRDQLGYGEASYQAPTRQLNVYIEERPFDEVRTMLKPHQFGIEGI